MFGRVEPLSIFDPSKWLFIPVLLGEEAGRQNHYNIAMEVTPKIDEYMKKIFLPLNPGVPESLLLLSVETKLAHALTFEKFVLNTPLSDDMIPINMYSLALYRSGGGKNRILKQIDNYLLAQWRSKIEYEWKEYEEDKFYRITKEAEKKYSGLKAKQAEYIDKHAPRQVLAVMNDMTPEGFTAQREMLQDWGKGSTLLVLDEFEDFFLSGDKYKASAMSMMKSVYDTGDYEPKGTKGEKEGSSTKGIASNAIFTASLTRLTKGWGFSKLQNMLLSGYARRCFVTVPELPPPPTLDENIKLFETTEELKGDKENLQGFLVEILNNPDKVITMNRGAINRLIEWKTNTGIAARKCPHETESVSLEHLYWKTTKLAGVLAAIESKGDKSIVITKDILDVAISQAVFFHNELKKLLVETDEVYEVYDYIKASPGTTTMTLRKQSFVPANNWEQWWKTNMNILAEYCESKNETFYVHKYSNRGRKYYITNDVKKLRKELEEVDKK